MSELTPAPRGYPIKLVRDRTAEIINSSGDPGDLFYGPCPPEMIVPELRKKLVEELAEYLVDGTAEELADVQAVIDALCVHAHSIPYGRLRAHVEADKRGGFLTAQMMYGRHDEFDGRKKAA